MFNFIFDGKLGNILAPMDNTNKLYLAIQHHKNVEFCDLMSTNTYDLTSQLESGYAAIHVACRYKNNFVVEYIISKGYDVDVPDAQGNTPLHYASKYSHYDLCKYLIDLGASAARRNNRRQSPYDVASNHIIRQYLLPLMMRDEQKELERTGATTDAAGNFMNPQQQLQSSMGFGYGAPSPGALPGGSAPPMMMQPPPAGPYGGYSMYPPTPGTSSSGTSSQAPSPVGPYPNQMPPLPTPGGGGLPPPTSTLAAGVGAPTAGVDSTAVMTGTVPPVSRPYGAPSAGSGPTRLIKPDGFHSSASDPLLQAKYGHTKQSINIAPPPTGAALSSGGAYPAPGAGPGAPQAFGMYAPPPPAAAGYSYGAAGGSIYNRYVPYDPHTNSAAAIPHHHQIQQQQQQQQQQQLQQQQLQQLQPPLPTPTPISSPMVRGASLGPPPATATAAPSLSNNTTASSFAAAPAVVLAPAGIATAGSQAVIPGASSKPPSLIAPSAASGTSSSSIRGSGSSSSSSVVTGSALVPVSGTVSGTATGMVGSAAGVTSREGSPIVTSLSAPLVRPGSNSALSASTGAPFPSASSSPSSSSSTPIQPAVSAAASVSNPVTSALATVPLPPNSPSAVFTPSASSSSAAAPVVATNVRREAAIADTSAGTGLMNVFNPATDSAVVDLNSSSSALM